MKKIIKNIIVGFGFLLLLILTTIGVLADTQVGIDVSTTEDMYADINLDAGKDIYTNIWFEDGNKHIYMNGVDVNYKDPSESSGLTRNVVFRDIYDGVIGINNGKIFLNTALNDKAKNIGRLLYSTFWTRVEQYQYQKAMDLRVTVIENTLEQLAPEVFCDVKKDYMEIYNMSSVPCGSETHYRNGMVIGDFIPERDFGGGKGILPYQETIMVNMTEDDYDPEIITVEERVELKQGYKSITKIVFDKLKRK